MQIIGKRSHVVDLNSAARQLAAETRIGMIDLEHMSLFFPESAQYLRDAHHPNEAFLLYGFWNIIFNYVDGQSCRDDSVRAIG